MSTGDGGQYSEPARKRCFVIAPIGEPGGEIRKRSDDLVAYVVRPVLEGLGYECNRANDLPEAGVITAQILEHLLQDELVVADLTGLNPNVMYELGVRHTVRRPAIQLMKRGEKPPFDVTTVKTIFVDHTDLGDVDACKHDLRRAVEAMHANPEAEVHSPISMSMELLAMRQSGRPIDDTLATILEQLSSIRTAMQSLPTTSGARPPWSDDEWRRIRAALFRQHLQDLSAKKEPEPDVTRLLLGILERQGRTDRENSGTDTSDPE